MTRTFVYRFNSPPANPVQGSTVSLDVREIETASMLEALQTPGVPYNSWLALDPLLVPKRKEFRFRETLGRAREVKTALSALFGRFVARAYLTRHFGLSVFAHPDSDWIRLCNNTRHRIVQRIFARLGCLRPEFAIACRCRGQGVFHSQGPDTSHGSGLGSGQSDRCACRRSQGGRSAIRCCHTVGSGANRQPDSGSEFHQEDGKSIDPGCRFIPYRFVQASHRQPDPLAGPCQTCGAAAPIGFATV